jgi:hypothetical protein
MVHADDNNPFYQFLWGILSDKDRLVVSISRLKARPKGRWMLDNWYVVASGDTTLSIICLSPSSSLAKHRRILPKTFQLGRVECAEDPPLTGESEEYEKHAPLRPLTRKSHTLASVWLS